MPKYLVKKAINGWAETIIEANSPDEALEKGDFEWTHIKENQIVNIDFSDCELVKEIKCKSPKNPCNRDDICIGDEVMMVQKPHQKTGQLTRGYVEQILTHSRYHHRGIKVKATCPEYGDEILVGRIVSFVDT